MAKSVIMPYSGPAVPDVNEPWKLFINKAELLAGIEQVNIVEAQVDQAVTWFKDVAHWDAPTDAAGCTVVDQGCFTKCSDSVVDAILRRAMLGMCTVSQPVMEAQFTWVQHIKMQAHAVLRERQWHGGPFIPFGAGSSGTGAQAPGAAAPVADTDSEGSGSEKAVSEDSSHGGAAYSRMCWHMGGQMFAGQFVPFNAMSEAPSWASR